MKEKNIYTYWQSTVILFFKHIMSSILNNNPGEKNTILFLKIEISLGMFSKTCPEPHKEQIAVLAFNSKSRWLCSDFLRNTAALNSTRTLPQICYKALTPPSPRFKWCWMNQIGRDPDSDLEKKSEAGKSMGFVMEIRPDTKRFKFKFKISEIFLVGKKKCAGECRKSKGVYQRSKWSPASLQWRENNNYV